jgi:hypothetical protein
MHSTINAPLPTATHRIVRYRIYYYSEIFITCNLRAIDVVDASIYPDSAHSASRELHVISNDFSASHGAPSGAKQTLLSINDMDLSWFSVAFGKPMHQCNGILVVSYYAVHHSLLLARVNANDNPLTVLPHAMTKPSRATI